MGTLLLIILICSSWADCRRGPIPDGGAMVPAAVCVLLTVLLILVPLGYVPR